MISSGKVNVAGKLSLFDEHWTPKVVGEFVRHRRDEEGEVFLIVPRGVEHRPVAGEEVHVLLFEPVGTLNTGNVRGRLTTESPEEI